MRNVRGVESKKTREASARTSFISSYKQPIAMKEEEDEEKEEAKEWGRSLPGAFLKLTKNLVWAYKELLGA